MIITLNQYKLFSGINNPNLDLQLQPIVDLVNTLIPRYCNTKFEPIVETGKRLTNNSNVLILPNTPIISIEGIEMLNTEVTLTDDQWYLDEETGIVEIIDPYVILPSSPRLVSVDYTWGTSDVPEDVTMAAKELVTYYHKREYHKTKTLSSGQSVDYTDASLFPIQVRSILDLYKVL